MVHDFDAMSTAEIDAWADARGVKVDGRWGKSRMVAHVLAELGKMADAGPSAPAAPPAPVPATPVAPEPENADDDAPEGDDEPSDVTPYVDPRPGTAPTWIYADGRAVIVHLPPRASLPSGWRDAP